MFGEIDEKLQVGTDWVKSVFEKVDYHHAIFFVILNGGLVGLATTGYLGEGSIQPASLPGFLYFINFFMMLLILTIKISPTSRFLVKVMVMAIVGFAIQWETMALMTPDAKNGFLPIADQGFAIFLLYSAFLGASIYAFTGNSNLERQSQMDSAEMQAILAELEELRKFKAQQSNVHPLHHTQAN